MFIIATIKDVAREAGVSISTVSFAINGTAPVAADTKKRIFEVIEKLNYKPNSIARGLVTQKSNNIGLYWPSLNSEMFQFSENNLFLHLLQGVGDVIDQHGYNLLMAWNSAKAINPNKIVEMAESRSVDGLLLVTPHQDDHVIDSLIRLRLPFVFLGTYIDNDAVSSVDVDNRQAAYDVTAHLIKQGHRRVAFISPAPMNHFVSQTRYQGYQQALKDAGLHAPSGYLYIGDNLQASGYSAVDAFYKLPEPPTAIVAGRDIIAVGIMQYAAENGLSIPGQLAVVSFENSKLAEEHKITSASTNLYQIGKQAAQLIFDKLGLTNRPSAATQQLFIPSEIIVRESSDSKANNAT
ncbi:LacI family DNA-binding transcriptional regulator [Paenibacillus sp. GCM10027626]|uniref:LacI family DNA-binding transcriptional regulator n=1 Tax=Paenibacillus sp. GCM10027626 TaxID=3273411 RepID=UPI00363995C6